MNLPDFAYKNVVDLYNLHRDLADGTDDQRRKLTSMIVEQTTYDDSMGGWGHKAEKGGSVSKDVMGKVTGTLIGWDLFNGSTRAPNPSPIPSFDLNPATQELRYYQGVNYLNHGGTTPPPTNGNDYQQQIDALKAQVVELEKQVEYMNTVMLMDGNKVALQTDSGKYVCAESGGGLKANQEPLATNRDSAGPWETFGLVKK